MKQLEIGHIANKPIPKIARKRGRGGPTDLKKKKKKVSQSSVVSNSRGLYVLADGAVFWFCKFRLSVGFSQHIYDVFVFVP